MTAVAIPSTRRSSGKLLIAGAAFLLLLVAVLGGVATEQMRSGRSQPSPVAIADIPTTYLALYEREGLRFGVDWAVLAAIGKVECDHGRSQAPGCNPPGTMNAAGATGPMQFLGSTWRRPPRWPSSTAPRPHAVMGTQLTATETESPTSGTRRRDRKRRAPPASQWSADRLPTAIFTYNHSDSHVAKVLAQAAGTVARSLLALWRSAAALAWAVAQPGASAATARIEHRSRRIRGRHAEPRPSWRNLRLLDVRALGDGPSGCRHRLDDSSAVAGERPSPRH